MQNHAHLSIRRRLKYGALRHFPGAVGRRYRRKLAAARALEYFERAASAAAGKICVDLGANVGEVTRLMALTARRVFAFEPDPYALEQLRANVSDLPNVSIVPAAVGTEDGIVPLYRRPQFDRDPAAHSRASSVLADKPNLSSETAVTVQQVNFLRWLSGLADDVWLIKMDIEGAEVALLEALISRPELLKRLDHVFVETHERFISDHRRRVAALRAACSEMARPRINLDWS